MHCGKKWTQNRNFQKSVIWKNPKIPVKYDRKPNGGGLALLSSLEVSHFCPFVSYFHIKLGFVTEKMNVAGNSSLHPEDCGLKFDSSQAAAKPPK